MSIFPCGGDIADRAINPKFGQKLDFFGRMTDWSGTLDQPTVLTGDFNVAPLESDVWNHKALLDVVSHTPIEVETLGRLQAASSWVDLGRHFIAAAGAALHLVELSRQGLGAVEPRAAARPYVGDPRPAGEGGVAPHHPARAQLGTAVGPYPSHHRVRL